MMRHHEDSTLAVDDDSVEVLQADLARNKRCRTRGCASLALL